MEGLPTLTCLIQHTLRAICSSSSSYHHNNSNNNNYSSFSSNKWVYAVFWKILPRFYPPPKWDYGGGIIDRAKGNTRNWILVWEDGYCDLGECEQRDHEYGKGIFGSRIFFKLSHEVYNFGEGLIGKVAGDNSHRWVFKDGANENDPSFMSSWNASIDPQPKAWESHFNSGIKTIAIISVRDGIIQLGSFDKILEDLNLVISIQRKFSYLQSIPGIYSIQRPFFTKGYDSNEVFFSEENDKKTQQLIGSKRVMVNIYDRESPPDISSIKLGYTTQNGLIGSNGPPIWPIPPLLPSNFKPLLEHVDPKLIGNQQEPVQKRKVDCLNSETELVVKIGFRPTRKTGKNDKNIF